MSNPLGTDHGMGVQQRHPMSVQEEDHGNNIFLREWTRKSGRAYQFVYIIKTAFLSIALIVLYVPIKSRIGCNYHNITLLAFLPLSPLFATKKSLKLSGRVNRSNAIFLSSSSFSMQTHPMILIIIQGMVCSLI